MQSAVYCSLGQEYAGRGVARSARRKLEELSIHSYTMKSPDPFTVPTHPKSLVLLRLVGSVFSHHVVSSLFLSRLTY